MGHSTRRLMMGAAGAGGDPTYVEDVFSTYLWRGDGQSGRPISNGIKLGNANAGNSVYFDDGHAGDYLQIAHTTNLCFGSGDFTIECWAYHIGDFDSYDALFGNWGSAGSFGYVLETVGSGATTDLEFYYYDDSNTFVGPVQGGQVTKNQWNHLCVCRSGNTIRLFVNGTMYGSGTSITTGIRDGSTEFTIGGQVAGAGWWNGYISNLRVTKGQALYTSNFTPSTQALTTTSQGATASNVKLLCCNKDTLTGATVTPSPIISDANYNGVPSTPIHSGFGPFTADDGEGGLVWIKSRTTGNVNVLFDTVRGANQRLRSDSDLAQSNADTLQPSFTNSGFTVGSGNEVNGSGNDYTSWTFRKQKGFFDIVTYTGTGVTQNIAHNLGSVPGAIFVKRTDSSHNWGVYHRGLNEGVTPERYRQRLNIAGQEDGNNDNGASYWANTAPTSTHFTVSGPQGGYINTNISGATYVAYIFAGGESTADTARSVDFDGSGDYLTQTCDAVLKNWWDQAFTVEYWVNADGFVSSGNNGPGVLGVCAPTSNGETWSFGPKSDAKVEFYYWNGSIQQVTTTKTLGLKQWYHLAMVYDGSSSIKIYINGTLEKSATVQGTPTGSSTVFSIGKIANGSEFNGRVSNVRITHQALYTSSFIPSTEPFTTTSQGATGSNVKLLCCNNSSTTGSTVTPETITANGDPTASTDSPFDDPEGYKFGEKGDQNIIKCGNLKTDSSNGAILDLPWEPQWFLYKQNNANNNWIILDCMRGWTTDGVDAMLYPNVVNAESSGNGYEELKARTIKFQGYGPNYDFMYIAIRRPDGYVGKPVEVGSDVYTLERGNSSSIEAYTSGFPVDFSLVREIGNASDWHQNSRLTQTYYLSTNTNGAQNGPYSAYSFDSNTGWLHGASAYNASWLSWMWKRHAGFDVVTDKGNGQTTKTIAHGLGVVPEMIWRKNRDNGSDNWQVYHIGLNGGTNPQLYRLYLNNTSAEMSDQWTWTNAPTDTHFTVGANGAVNRNNDDFITMLFASVEGVSKVGYYDGTGSAGNAQNIGFQPRFIMIKRANAIENWPTFNTILGLGAGNDPWLNIDDDASQFTGQDLLSVSSTGFTLNDGQAMMNASGGKYIYYAHA